jgi:hypothetical protein
MKRARTISCYCKGGYMGTPRKLPLRFLQLTWVLCAIVTIAQSIIIDWVGTTSQITAWLSLFPQIAMLIGTMGGFAFGGPLLSDKINGGRKNES